MLALVIPTTISFFTHNKASLRQKVKKNVFEYYFFLLGIFSIIFLDKLDIYFEVWYAALIWCADRSVLRGLGAALGVILGPLTQLCLW